MMKSIEVLRVGALAALLTVLPTPRVGHAEEASKAPLLDASRPETWDAAVQRLEKEQDAVAESLIAVAKDEKRTPDDRRKAILLLSRVPNARSLEFLIANVSLGLVGRVLTADDMAKQYPCRYALSQRRSWAVEAEPSEFPAPQRPDWRSAQAIVFGVRRHARTPRDLMHLAVALEAILYKGLAADVVQHTMEHHAPPGSTWRKNLTAILTYLKQS